MKRMGRWPWVLVGLGLLALGVALAGRTGAGPGSAAAPPYALPRELPPDAPCTAPLPAPREALRIRGRVVDARGPVVGATVVATAPEPGESLPVRPCSGGHARNVASVFDTCLRRAERVRFSSTV